MKLSSSLRAAAKGNYLVLQGVARTFLPSDVQAALAEIGASRSGAPTLVTKQPAVFAPLPRGHVTSPPPSSATFHLTFPSPESAKLAQLAIDRSPSRFLGFPAGPAPVSSSTAQKVPGKRAARGKVVVRRVEQDATRWLMMDAAEEWKNGHGRSSPSPAQAPTESSAFTGDNQNPTSLATYLSELRQRNPAPFDPAKRGLQVLLRGLPARSTEEQVRGLTSGFKVDDTYGVWRVDKLAADKTSIHIISLPTPSEAHRFVRAVHNRRYGGIAFERDYVMRAEVVW